MIQKSIGMSLVEVLIALAILSTVLLSLSASGIYSLSLSKEALVRTEALASLNSMTELLRAAHSQNLYDSQSIQNEILKWQTQVGQQFPQGKAQIKETKEAIIITLTWRGNHPHSGHPTQVLSHEIPRVNHA